MLPINDNSLDLSRYRGKITRCPVCQPVNKSKEQTDAVRMERITLGKACLVCLGRGFVAICKNCGGDGIYKGSASAFGGGDVPHHSTCNPCSGTGMFAVNQPADWKDDTPVAAQEVVAPAPAAVQQ
jgi:hypothetical protein